MTDKFVSKGSAQLTIYGDPAGNVTETVFYLEGNNLMATHLCARGDQPRLLAKDSGSGYSLIFELLDVTNLWSKDDAHMVTAGLFGAAGVTAVSPANA